MCRAAPTPATYWDWIASIAPINFLPGNQDLVDYFAAVKAEIAQRSRRRLGGAERALPARLRRHHELEQARLAGEQVRLATAPRS